MDFNIPQIKKIGLTVLVIGFAIFTIAAYVQAARDDFKLITIWLIFLIIIVVIGGATSLIMKIFRK